VAIAVALTVLEAAGLLFIAVIGVPTWTRTSYLVMPHGVDGVLAAAGLIFFAYLGFDELGNLTEEMRQPERDLPQAVLLLLVSASRSVYGMAGARALPRALARVKRFAVPSAATTAVLALTAAAIAVGDLTHVAALTDVAVLVAFMVRERQSDVARDGRSGSVCGSLPARGRRAGHAGTAAVRRPPLPDPPLSVAAPVRGAGATPGAWPIPWRHPAHPRTSRFL
jgi:hypothetical protein